MSLSLIAAKTGVNFAQEPGKVRIEIDGQLFTEYCYSNTPRPYFYPLLGPGQLPMTRHWPLEASTNESHDHLHHRSLWFAHSSVNGLDFWTESTNGCRIAHQGFGKMESGPEKGILQCSNNWLDAKDRVVCSDQRELVVYVKTSDERVFDYKITLFAPSNHDVTLGDDKDGMMAVRLAETMRLKQPKGPGLGHIQLSTGVMDEAAWGKRADWCDYSGPVNGQTVGVTVMDHPSNLRHPTWWHVRDYGLMAANPFGVHDFEKKPKGAGNYVLPAGQSVTFRYRFLLHKGNAAAAGVAKQYEEFVRTSAP